jgi:prepilin-type N-terminal cleavage/methylation domain-containing protein
MAKSSYKEDGFTLIEVLVSVGIMLIFLPFAANMLTNSQLLASYSKHKIQAAYAAQQILETQRQIISTYFNPLPLLSGQSKTIGPSSVILDTKGNYNNLNCNTNTSIFCGTSIITVTPAVYTNSAGVKNTSLTVDHIVVQIFWFEQIVKLKVSMSETYATDIANDLMLN